jgi:C4-type Zn-finger protein
MAKDPAERKNIITTVEGFVNQFASVIVPVMQRVKEDPKFAYELQQALKNGGRVINNEDKQPVTGSVT